MEAGFLASTFDMVVGMHVIEHTQNPSRFVGEIKRILKPGGRLYVVWGRRGTSGISRPAGCGFSLVGRVSRYRRRTAFRIGRT
jgi:SAM-dependent methyltransferase